MAYSTTVDYKAIQNALKKQMESTTDPTTLSGLQSQYDAAEQSRTEKIASDLNTYGKYATASELDSAAGIQAQNQIGTQYETQAKNIGKYYDTAQQNANNNALSRGMARSSFVQDRMANIDMERASALTDNDAAKALAIQNAKTQILNNYQNNKIDAENTAYSQNLAKAKTLAQYGDFSGYSDVSGYTAAQIAAMKAKYDEENAPKTSYSGSYSGGGGTSVDETTPTVEFNGGAKSQIYSGALTDTAANYQVGMNRTAQGQLATIQRLYNAGQITEAQASALINKFNLG